MSDISTRVHGIRQWLEKNSLDGIIIPHEDEYLSEYIPPENERLAWITGFTGSAGITIISINSAAIFVDGRYTVQVKQQVDSNIIAIHHIVDTPFLKWIKNKPNKLSSLLKRRSFRTIVKFLISKSLRNFFDIYFWNVIIQRIINR